METSPEVKPPLPRNLLRIGFGTRDAVPAFVSDFKAPEDLRVEAEGRGQACGMTL